MTVVLTSSIPDLKPVTRMAAKRQPPVLKHARCACGGKVYLAVRMFKQRMTMCDGCGHVFADADMKPLVDAYDIEGRRIYP